MRQPLELWRHPAPGTTPMSHFMSRVNSRHSLAICDYESLHRWSINDPAAFWAEVWSFVGIKASHPYDCVLSPNSPMFPRPDFFAGSRLNFAENLLYPPGVALDSVSPALVTVTENNLSGRMTSWHELRKNVRCCSNALRNHGVCSGDVVAGFISNHAEAVVSSLATASIGAVWTSISPDTGVSAVFDRLSQIQPAALFADNGMIYNGKLWPALQNTRDIVEKLAKKGLRLAVVIENVAGVGLGLKDLQRIEGVHALNYSSFLESSGNQPLKFEQLPASHPLYVLYSSGTTGLPKPIVHTALGTLIQHKKEHILHCSIDQQSRMLYYTTTSWMMWHWSLSVLATGASLVLYTGSPFKPRSYSSLPSLISEFQVSHFGTSATYLSLLESKSFFPRDSLDLSCLRAIYSTASPLPPSTFSFTYRAFPSTVNLASITGGTDIISLFGAPCPLLPVHAGEVQCIGLGMAVAAVDSVTGKELKAGDEGDLVCTVPFPSQPLTFYGDGGNDKYWNSYFSRFPGIWHHGDFIRINPATSGLVMLGRSDGVLKPSGVRFGSAEIYNVLARCFPEIQDAICVGRQRPAEKDETVCLFVKLVDGRHLDVDLRARICKTIRSELSPRHVPGLVDEAKEGIPVTSNGKKIEIAVKQVISGKRVRTHSGVANPEALDWFHRWAEETV